MNREKYLAKRAELYKSAEEAIEKNDLKASGAIRLEITKLDTDFEASTLEAANLAALSGAVKTPKIISNSVKGKTEEGPTKMTDVKEKEIKADAEYSEVFALKLMGKKLNTEQSTIYNAINTTDDGITTVIPKTVRAEIWKEMKDLHPIVQDTPYTSVPGYMSLPKEKGDTEDADWYDEATPVADGTKVVIGSIDLVGYELSKVIKLSWKLSKMGTKEFLAYVKTKIADKMGAAIAGGILNGKGVPGEADTFKAQPKGIIPALKAESTTPQVITYTASALAYKDVTKLMSKIKSGYKKEAVIYASSDTIWNELANVETKNGKTVFVANAIDGGVGKVFGVTVKEEAGMADGQILLANSKRGYAMNVTEDIHVYTEVAMRVRSNDYMGYAILDGAPLTTKAFALLEKA